MLREGRPGTWRRQREHRRPGSMGGRAYCPLITAACRDDRRASSQGECELLLHPALPLLFFSLPLPARLSAGAPQCPWRVFFRPATWARAHPPHSAGLHRNVFFLFFCETDAAANGARQSPLLTFSFSLFALYYSSARRTTILSVPRQFSTRGRNLCVKSWTQPQTIRVA